ncbi:exodeoxyribonuclease V subunit gamma, partial [Nocardia cyriacigeorgica]|uniref:exodeoxyribonuclease V subunit gamma n=1 Tax=Nocardia cyriacigeorgica TaxID=135487 RepID=UPI002456B17E
GERDPRAEDRQLLLDAIMAAGERLVLLHTGSDPVSGTHRPPATIGGAGGRRFSRSTIGGSR